MRGRRNLIALLVSALVCLALPGQVHATMTLPMTMPEIVQQSGRAFVGRCVSMEFGPDENGLPAATIEFDVSRSLKGVDSDRVILKQYGLVPDAKADRLVPDVGFYESEIVSLKSMMGAGASYRMDEEIILFLYPESELGFSSPVGFGQGLFRVKQSEDGRELVTNIFQNIFLNRNNVPRVGISAYHLKHHELELDELLDWVSQLQEMR